MIRRKTQIDLEREAGRAAMASRTAAEIDRKRRFDTALAGYEDGRRRRGELRFERPIRDDIAELLGAIIVIGVPLLLIGGLLRLLGIL